MSADNNTIRKILIHSVPAYSRLSSELSPIVDYDDEAKRSQVLESLRWAIDDVNYSRKVKRAKLQSELQDIEPGSYQADAAQARLSDLDDENGQWQQDNVQPREAKAWFEKDPDSLSNLLLLRQGVSHLLTAQTAIQKYQEATRDSILEANYPDRRGKGKGKGNATSDLTDDDLLAKCPETDELSKYRSLQRLNLSVHSAIQAALYAPSPPIEASLERKYPLGSESATEKSLEEFGAELDATESMVSQYVRTQLDKGAFNQEDILSVKQALRMMKENESVMRTDPEFTVPITYRGAIHIIDRGLKPKNWEVPYTMSKEELAKEVKGISAIQKWVSNTQEGFDDILKTTGTAMETVMDTFRGRAPGRQQTSSNRQVHVRFDDLRGVATHFPTSQYATDMAALYDAVDLESGSILEGADSRRALRKALTAYTKELATKVGEDAASDNNSDAVRDYKLAESTAAYMDGERFPAVLEGATEVTLDDAPHLRILYNVLQDAKGQIDTDTENSINMAYALASSMQEPDTAELRTRKSSSEDSRGSTPTKRGRK